MWLGTLCRSPLVHCDTSWCEKPRGEKSLMTCLAISTEYWHVTDRQTSFFLIRGGTRSLRMPALRPASQAGPMRNPRERTSVVLRDTILMVCVVCSV